MTIRIVCLISTLTLFTSATVQADDTEEWSTRTSVGLQLGAVFATFHDSDAGDPPDASRYRTGFGGGGTCAVRLTRVLSLQGEINFAVKGSRFNTGFPGSSETSYMSYLEFPLLVRGSIPSSGVFELHGYLGPAVGILLDAHTRFDDGRYFDIERNIVPIDIGLVAGGGITVSFRDAGALGFDIRYNLGLRNWIDNPMIESESFNRAIYLTVGYRADLATLSRLFGGSR